MPNNYILNMNLFLEDVNKIRTNEVIDNVFNSRKDSFNLMRTTNFHHLNVRRSTRRALWEEVQ